MNVTQCPLHLIQAADFEVSRDRIDLIKLLDLMSTIAMFSNQDFAHVDRLDHCKYTREEQEKLKAVVEGHVNKYVTAVVLLAGILTVAGAGTSNYALMQGTEDLEKFGHNIVSVGGSVQSTSQIFSNSKAAGQELNQAAMKEMEKKARSVEEDARRHDNQAQSSYEASRKIREMILQFFLQM